MEYRSVKEMQEEWQVSERSIVKYCEDGRIPGVMRFGRSWAIPADAVKPVDRRCKKQKSEKAEKLALDSVKMNGQQEKKKVGALIIAAGKYDQNTSPLLKVGTTSVIRRIVLIFQQVHVKPIVIVTGYQSLELEHHLSDYGVIFIHNERYDQMDKFESVKLGLSFLKDKCDQLFFTSVKNPMFMPSTLTKMTQLNKKVIVPQFEERNGHPLLLETGVIGQILQYKGKGGMRAALREAGIERTYLQVEDEGVLLSVENISRLEESLQGHNENLLHSFVRLSIEKNRLLFDERAKLLLCLIRDAGSIQGACRQMALSRAKAWEMITVMEEELGFTVVKRQQGGSRERTTSLTEKGEKFLQFYMEYEEAVKTFAREEFARRMSNVF